LTKEENLILSADTKEKAVETANILGISERTLYYKKAELVQTNSEIKRIVGAADFHTPYENKVLFQGFLGFLKDFKPNIFVMAGDALDIETVSFWLRNKRRQLEGKRIKKEYAYYNENIHKPITKTLKKGTVRYWFKGNHEDRIRKAIDEKPEGEGYWEVEKNIDLKDWQVVEYPKAVKIGKIYFMHGIYTNKYFAEKTVRIYGKNIVFFHKHTLQVHTLTTPINNESHTGWGIPAMCNLNPEYAKEKPNEWLNGFVAGYILPNGNFNLYPIVATNNHFVWEGKLY